MEQVWDFMSSPRNLKKITPPYMGFDITNEPLPEKMYAGMIITYKVSPMFNIPMTWVTEITHVRDREYFVDEQRVGPYTIWHHQHLLEKIENGVLIGHLAHRLEREYSRRLRQRLQNQYPGHDRMVRKMPHEKWFVDRDVLVRVNGSPRIAVDNSIDQQERVAMRKMLDDPMYIHSVQEMFSIRSIFLSSSPSLSASAARRFIWAALCNQSRCRSSGKMLVY